MDKKLLCLALVTLLFFPSFPAAAQQPKKVPRIGVLSGGSSSSDQPITDVFRQGLKDLGYVEGQNVAIEYRYDEGKPQRLPDLAAELVRLKVDVVVTSGGPAAGAAKSATTAIPIVITNVGDPVGEGLVVSLAHPGGNVTGFSTLAPELSGKQLELLKEAFPRVSRVAVLWNHFTAANVHWLSETKITAGALQITLQPHEVRDPHDFGSAFSAMKREHAHALIALRNSFTNAYRTQIIGLAANNRLPAMYMDSQFVNIGGLMSYGPNRPDLERRAATYVDKILKGAKPADLPVEQPTKFELVINLKTAKQIGVTIPQSVLYQADKVIK